MPAGVRAERDGPLVRTVGWPRGGIVEYRDLAGLEGAALDALIARQVRIFAARGESFEWKLHGHDRPSQACPIACAPRGFAPQEPETLLAAHAATIAAAAPALPPGAALRSVAGASRSHRGHGGAHLRRCRPLLAGRDARPPAGVRPPGR